MKDLLNALKGPDDPFHVQEILDKLESFQDSIGEEAREMSAMDEDAKETFIGSPSHLPFIRTSDEHSQRFGRPISEDYDGTHVRYCVDVSKYTDPGDGDIPALDPNKLPHWTYGHHQAISVGDVTMEELGEGREHV